MTLTSVHSPRADPSLVPSIVCRAFLSLHTTAEHVTGFSSLRKGKALPHFRRNYRKDFLWVTDYAGVNGFISLYESYSLFSRKKINHFLHFINLLCVCVSVGNHGVGVAIRGVVEINCLLLSEPFTPGAILQYLCLFLN